MPLQQFPGVSLARVAISSPSDVSRERDAIERSIYEWNQENSEGVGITFLSLRWERDVTPGLDGNHPQSAINKAIVYPAHSMFAIFGVRVGSATTKAISGTVEEIEEAQALGIVPHVFFSKSAIPRDHDPEQLRQLTSYRDSLLTQGVLAEFKNVSELSKLVKRSLSGDARKFIDGSWSIFQPRIGSSARVYINASSATKHELVIENVGTSTIMNVGLRNITRNSSKVRMINVGQVFTLEPNQNCRFPFTDRLSGGDEVKATVGATWGGVVAVDTVTLLAPTP